MRGTSREASLSRDPEGYAKAREIDVCFHRDPAFGKHGGKLLFYGL